MSRNHIIFNKKNETLHEVTYILKSPDFGADEIIGEVNIFISTGQYSFHALGKLTSQLIIPPNVFDLPVEQQNAVIQQRYQNASYAGLMSLTAKMIRKLLIDRKFPSEVYGAV